jgi:TonB-dependent receptor
MSEMDTRLGRMLRCAVSSRALALAVAASTISTGALAQTAPAQSPAEPTSAQQPQPVTAPQSQQTDAIVAKNPPPATEPDPVAGDNQQAGGEEAEVEAVVVTGYRASLQSAIAVKRNSNVQVDAINAEDIADFPDANLAESLQRLPGVSIDRENGEGRTITVRGLGSDFTRVRLNGLEAQSTAGPSDSGTSPNRGRGFDFNTFASELFSSLRVQKTASAETDEGSLGATVDLITGKPFDFSGRRLALSLQNSYYENGGKNSPRIAGLFSQRFETPIGDMGFLGSVAYNTREQIIDSYLRQAGQSDFQYRGATNAQNTAIRGFATSQSPANVNFQPNGRVNNAARALLNDLTIFPALANLNHQELEQERLGLTGAFQWRPREGTTVTVDAVGSRLEQTSTLNVLVPVGLNRNNTNTTLGLANPTNAQRLAAYPGVCTERAGNAFQDPIDCRGTQGTGTPLPNFPNSLNPRNLSAFDYYNDPDSPGYIAPGRPNYDPRGLSFRQALVGRPATIVRDAQVNASNQAVYLLLDDVDLAARADQGSFTTDFRQFSVNLDHQFTDRFSGKFLWGQSESKSDSQGLLAEFNRMDSDNFVYDERGGGEMPAFDYGFNTADPANWDFVKGFSAIRHFRRFVNNEYQTLRADFAFDLNDALTFKFGATERTYDFSTGQFQRLTSDVNNPSFLEAGTTVASTGKLIEWGQGLNVPGNTPTSWWGPDLDKFKQVYGFDCNCINEFGDWRLSVLSNPGNQFSVAEKDTSFYGQVDFLFDVAGRELRGNAGVRHAITDLNSFGFSPAARPLTANNKYEDTLPSFNLAYEVAEDMYLRFAYAKVMARPLLGNLSPGVSGFSTTLPTSGTPSITVGNPFLNPFRATNYDASFEWYFAPGGLISVALFRKEIDTFPQNLTRLESLQDVLDPATITALLDALGTTPANIEFRNYVLAGGDFTVRQFQDAPGGTISGVEVSYQQNLTFLPGLAERIGINAPWLENFGVQANYTHLESELTYILNPDNPTGAGLAAGPFTGASPDAFNLTGYYDTDKFSARLSAAYRASYVTTFPLAAGTCAPGQCDSPFVNDFGGSQSTFNLDGSATYKINDNITLNAEVLNITNQNVERYVYTPQLVGNYASVGRQYFVGLRFRY